jgi:hypothetical protein
MANAEADFRRWFVESLDPLRTNGDAGFIFVFVAFPLLERYLRRKSGCPDGQYLTDGFFKHLGLLFDGIAGNERKFWDCYRNGLLHQATFPQAKLDKRTGIWVTLPDAGISGYDPRPVYFLPEKTQIFLNPISFFDAVTNAILKDFAAYEKSASTQYYKLPWPYDPSAAVPNTVPTINVSLRTPGSETP